MKYLVYNTQTINFVFLYINMKMMMTPSFYLKN